MKQGTVSVLIGCHSPVHSVLVLLAWHRLYHSWPSWWQIVCIFLHDIGHIGKNYLDNLDEKKEHYKLGAGIALRLFGERGYSFTAGHDKYSGVTASGLYRADKYSWVMAPSWWLFLITLVEPKLIRLGMTRRESVVHFQQAVKDNASKGFQLSTHELYIRDWESRGNDAT